jgi:predicted ester cyclase
MKKCIQTGALLVAVMAMAAPGCKKKEEKTEAPPAAAKTTVDTPPTDETPEAPAADPVAKLTECWGAWNARDEAKFSACYGPKSVVTQADAETFTGPEAILANTKKFWTAFPDMKGEIQLTLVNGTTIAVLVHMTGTNTGPMAMPDGSEMPATGKKHAANGIQVFDLSDPENLQEMDFWDIGLLMGQITEAPGTRPVAESTGLIEDAPVVASDSDVEKANLALIKKHADEWGTKDPAGVLANYAADAHFSYTGAPMDMKGHEQITGFLGAMKGAFPDLKIATHSAWAAGDYVFLHAEGTGKNTGPMPPKLEKPTGKDVKLQLGEIYKVKDGKVTHQWVVSNGMAMAMQLGLMGGDKPAEKK